MLELAGKVLVNEEQAHGLELLGRAARDAHPT
jgi:hypothetical protein